MDPTTNNLTMCICNIKVAIFGSVAVMVSLLYENAPVLQEAAAGALRDLGANASSDLMETIATSGAIPALVSLLGPHNSADVQIVVAAALANLALHAQSKVKIAAAGTVSALITMLGPQNSQAAKDNAASAMANLLFDADNIIKIEAAGAIPVLVALLGPQNMTEIKANAAWSLASLAFIDDNRVEIAAAGAIPVLVGLLGPQNNHEIQHMSLVAIANLAINKTNRVKITAAGAIPLLVALLGPENKLEIQELAVMAFMNLAFNHDDRIKIAAAGAIPFVVALLDKKEFKSKNRDCIPQQHAASLLASLAHENAESQAEIAAAGAIPLLVALLDLQNKFEIRARAASALECLACNADNSIMIANAGAIPILVTMLDPENKVQVQVHAAKALDRLACNDDNKINIVGAGAIPALVTMMDPQNKNKIQGTAAGVLGQLIVDNDDNKIAAANAVPVLVALLDPQHKIDIRTRVCSLRALSNLATNKTNNANIAAAGAIPFLVAMLDPKNKSKHFEEASMDRDSLGDLIKARLDISHVSVYSIYAQLDPQMYVEQTETAARVLGSLTEIPTNRVDIAAAGAIPFLVALLDPQSRARALGNMAAYVDNNSGAIPFLVALLDPKNNVEQVEAAVRALSLLSRITSNRVQIAVAGAIPALRVLLDSSTASIYCKHLASFTVKNLVTKHLSFVDSHTPMIATTTGCWTNPVKIEADEEDANQIKKKQRSS